MESKLLTVVIPTYNMEKYLAKCLDSLILTNDSLMELLEVLVIIDGAKDRSSEIAHRYQEKYPQTFRVIDKDNGNYGSCVNRGLKEAKGKYIKILDADDQFDSKAFDRVTSYLKDIEVDLVLTNFKCVDETGKDVSKNVYHLPEKECLHDEYLASLGDKMAMHAVIYKTDNLRKIGYHQSEGISYTDQEWIGLPMSTVKTFVYINEMLYLYLVGRDGQTMNLSALAKNANQNIIVLRSIISQYKELTLNQNADAYQIGHLKFLSKNIYDLFLFNTKIMDINLLHAFDYELKLLLPKLYDYLGKQKEGHLPYVKLWRKVNYTHDHGVNRYFRERKYRYDLRLMNKIDNNLYISLNPWFRKHVVNPKLRRNLKNKDFTLICNNCTGACILHDLGLKFNSPFVNLWLKPTDFLKYCSNIEYYKKCKLQIHLEESNKYNYPVGILDDIIIYFQHYKNFEQAKEKWEERTRRINKDNMFILWVAKDGYIDSDIERFKQITNKKIAFFKEPHNGISNAFYIPGYENTDNLGLLMDFVKHQYCGRKYYDAFDYVSWFNNEI